jgi:TRAP-type C4-dicarboxylate transport system permease small subunit
MTEPVLIALVLAGVLWVAGLLWMRRLRAPADQSSYYWSPRPGRDWPFWIGVVGFATMALVLVARN